MSKLYLEELARIQERLTALFERAIVPVGFPPGDGGAPGTWTPVIDVLETDASYVLHAELPGVRREDIDLRIQGGGLEISGRLRPPGEDRSFLRMERTYGPFRRVVDLEGPVDEEGVSARFENGLLTVTVPKLTSAGGGGER